MLRNIVIAKMTIIVGVTLLLISLSASSTSRKLRCQPKLIARRLGYEPNAWKLIVDMHPRYHLMFHSDGQLPGIYKCLSTSKSKPDPSRKWERSIEYHSSPNVSYTYRGSYKAWTTKTEENYVYDDTLNVSYYRETSVKYDFERFFSANDVIYSRPKLCLVMTSNELGLQVWVDTDYIKQYRRIPYACTFFYEACAVQTTKIWVYDWDHCPLTTHLV
ncbi:uncharacterized protein LOC119384818 [Rhipicephalus sanguineus]|uniref:uncharacterized protein LOC119384818 n=1 Tax=Rhipicephalus sanguineus TaxID=34632 RepID=UPI0018939E7F|nr:uncharacterized protein LOC119384818 [Rhipicephalus sanguineus]